MNQIAFDGFISQCINDTNHLDVPKLYLLEKISTGMGERQSIHFASRTHRASNNIFLHLRTEWIFYRRDWLAYLKPLEEHSDAYLGADEFDLVEQKENIIHIDQKDDEEIESTEVSLDSDLEIIALELEVDPFEDENE